LTTIKQTFSVAIDKFGTSLDMDHLIRPKLPAARVSDFHTHRNEHESPHRARKDRHFNVAGGLA
jgi:hypothetical protein